MAMDGFIIKEAVCVICYADLMKTHFLLKLDNEFLIVQVVLCDFPIQDVYLYWVQKAAH